MLVRYTFGSWPAPGTAHSQPGPSHRQVFKTIHHDLHVYQASVQLGTIRWEDWCWGRNMWLLLGEKPQRRACLLREESSYVPFSAHPPSLFSSIFTMRCVISFTGFWHVCFLPIEGKLLEGKDIYLFCSLMGLLATGYIVGPQQSCLMKNSMLVCAGHGEGSFRTLYKQEVRIASPVLQRRKPEAQKGWHLAEGHAAKEWSSRI